MNPIKPMLCQEHPNAFNDPSFIWETKYDGVRMIAVVNVDGAGVRLFARSGAEKTRLYPDLKIETKVPAILDGEVTSGSFSDIQHRNNRENGIGLVAKQFPAKFNVFDVIQVEAEGHDFSLATTPLMKRKEVLTTILTPTDNVFASEYTENGVELFQKIRDAGGEGVVGKRKDSYYIQNKREWFKIKTWLEGKFVAVGYTAGTGWRADTFGALVLTDPAGKYVGAVGTGFTASDIRSLKAMFSPVQTSPFSRDPEPATWIKPFGVKIRYLEVTNDGMLRFPSFRGVI